MNSNIDKIAVIGMACRFPGANNVDEFWKNLLEGKETIRRFTDGELSKTEFRFEENRNNPNFVKARGILDNADKFDAEFFGMTPREAAMTDPQHRLWFETAWEAFENAGCDPTNYQGSIGVFTGTCLNTYLLNNVLRDPLQLENYIRMRLTDSLQIMTANDPSYISTKTAFKFNLKGPAINIQTACSTSLVAISEACQSLVDFKSDLGLAGAACVLVPQETGYIYEEGAIISPDGICRPFDVDGRGTVFSNGVGAVVLKRYEDAIRDHDRIYALVSGWAVNNDGSEKLSYTAPSIEGQAEVIKMAHASANILPEEICYVETHGTGTQLGDPIEIAGLKKAFGDSSDKKYYCGLGSVKSNIGHTDVASGVASFIKTCLAAYYKKIPPTINFASLNPHIEIENSPFYIQSETKEWDEQRPLKMGVSSFGVGGTNAHVIVERLETKDKKVITPSEWPSLILLSAKSENSLNRRREDLLGFLKVNHGVNIQDVVFTLGTGRNHMFHRSFTIADNINEIISGEKQFISGKKDNLITNVAFMFPGQGAQYVSMGKDLYNSNQLFKQILDDCFDVVKSECGEDLKSILFESKNAEEADKRLAETAITQPALFIIEYALAKIFEQFDIKPTYLIGHSIGEYTAACIAGVFDVNTALKIVIKRGRLMQKMKSGKMLAVRTGLDQLRNLNNQLFEIAADNAPELCTISFKTENSEKVISLLDSNNIQYVPLNTSHAFHSEAFNPILAEFAGFVSQFSLKEPVLPFISCLTGEFITNEQAVSGKYWAQQLRNTVLFRRGISTICRYEDVVFLEIGPSTHLSSLVRQNNDVENKKAIIATLGKQDSKSEPKKVVSALGNMFVIGINLNTNILQKDLTLNKISLPGYPFEKKRHWIDYEPLALIDTQLAKTKGVASIDVDEVENTSSFSEKSTEKPEEKSVTTVLNIWKSLTGIEEISPDQDFFEMGGHSLLALQIMTRIKEELNFNISLKTFYENPTINKLNSIITQSNQVLTRVTENIPEISLTNLPLSSNQKRLWIVSQLDGLNPAYNIPFTYHFKGDLNIKIFRESIDVLFQRHFIMFSVFKIKNDQPYCEIVPKPVTVEFIDFSDDLPANSKNNIYSFAGEDSRKLFNIESGPLFRLYLLKQDSSNFFFHATINHLIFDGWSWSVFIQDFKKIYEGLLLNKAIDLDEIKTNYLDYLGGLSSSGDKINEEELTKFWIKNLRGATPKLNFPYDYPRKEVPTGFGEKETIKILFESTARLREISRKEHSTLFATVLSALGVLFQRYSGENDICIGTHVANRSRSNLEKIFGMFVNTVPIRLRIDDKEKFGNYLNYVKNVLLEAIDHQDLPFEKIVEALNPERSSNINPFFQVSVVWQYNSTLPLELTNVTGEYINIKEGVSPFDITFYLWEKEDHIAGEIEYNTDLLSRKTIIRLRDNFVHLLETIGNNPDQNLAEFSIISEDDRIKLSEFNNTEAAISDMLIQNSFENQAGLTPLKTAVISGDKSLTYRELNTFSNQLANYLADQGVEQGDIVGICLERSVDMLVSVLAVLKSGCCYLPLDPSFPEDRLKYMYEDSGAKIFISQSSLASKFSQYQKAKIVLLDSHKDKIGKFSTGKPALNIDSKSFAYIIYTSGSTGKPKGVKVHHEAIVNLTESMSGKPGIRENDILLAVVTLSFDMSLFELFMPISNGATVVIASAQETTDGQALIKLIDEYDITMLQATPSLWHLLLASGWKGKKDLRAFCGGEPLTPVLLRQILPRVAELWNCYGPTETTVYSTCTRMRDADDQITIGRPISNTKIHILDKNRKMLPIGVIGEVYIGGLGVTRGYHNKPELTAEKFVSLINGEIFYKTGDVGRFLPDGNIELFGRIDNQIKLRGFRIEPGEIESHLSRLSNVNEAVIKVHKFDAFDERLVAFLNVDPEFRMTNDDIKHSLALNLPGYMIPSFFQISQGFPRLPNGKINKEALKFNLTVPDLNDSTTERNLNHTEKIIFNIWSDILKTNNILITDNFFDIGGNSLLAISVSSKIKSAFNIEMRLRDFFDSPRIEELAESVDILLQSRKNPEIILENSLEKLKIIDGEI
jgi:amino acid adenylation domain-containing protein